MHEPVLINYELKNDSGKPIKLDLGQDRKGSFLFVVTLPNGTRKELPRWSREGISRVGTVSISPNQVYADTLLLNEWMEFQAAGRYGIEVRLTKAIPFDPEATTLEPAPFYTTLEILPRDARVLTRICEELARQIEQSPSVQDAMEAGLRLSHVRDPVAVPFLERALRSGKSVETFAVSGLESIGDQSAARVLISQLAEPDSAEADINTRSGTRSALAKSALERIQERTADLETRKIIQEALARQKK
ncbi:MAG: hypothetical protein L0312_02845 [Acidobacteria bacterium]|nr:hypothetical protein [Acidobacteriota bacterium]